MLNMLGSVFVVLAVAASSVLTSAVSNEFQSSKLVPDLIPVAPDSWAYVFYKGQASETSPGEHIPPEAASLPPEVTWEANEGYYTLVMLDPDAPSHDNPSVSPFCHWLVVNIPGEDVEGSEELAKYIAPGPAPGGGLHRYAIFVYQQQSRIDCDEKTLVLYSADRNNFPLSDFLKKYELTSVPVAGTYFRVGVDLTLF